ncbi:hypothetical protein MC7420_3226 [Coleofasciculus chthonoplastes PCC 7420]|uniref:Uncharacterized protein n=1 Tax=Coleofasciculus chthonoplastes PCC 7420 TaxID=118168 RepID=B4VZ70_9CYAN|nr:hypothetical protein MC7420_3226 [Coleofasciculus chthonoplastes PCC 7420]
MRQTIAFWQELKLTPMKACASQNRKIYSTILAMPRQW